MLFIVLQFLLVASSMCPSTAFALRFTLSNDHGNITSPNYPLNYGDGLDNRYHIKAPPGYVIYFKFHFFELEDKDKHGEDTDVLKIIDGKKDQDQVRMFFSGKLSTPFHIITNSNQVRVIFMSNTNGVTFKGFHVTYQVYKKETSCSNVATFRSCKIPSVPSSQCIEGCVGNMTLIPYNYSTPCYEYQLTPLACVDKKELERCEVDANYRNCKYTVDEMIRIFEILEIEEGIDSTEEEDDGDSVDLSLSIASKCQNYCRKHPKKSNVWSQPKRCSKLKRKHWWTEKRHKTQRKTCMTCRRKGCKLGIISR